MFSKNLSGLKICPTRQVFRGNLFFIFNMSGSKNLSGLIIELFLKPYFICQIIKNVYFLIYVVFLLSCVTNIYIHILVLYILFNWRNNVSQHLPLVLETKKLNHYERYAESHWIRYIIVLNVSFDLIKGRFSLHSLGRRIPSYMYHCSPIIR